MSAFRHGKPVRRRLSKRVLLLCLAAFITAIAVFSTFWYKTNLQAIGGSEDTIIITVEEGMNEAQVAALMKSKGLIRSAIAYEIHARISGNVGKMQAGGYKLNKNMTVAEILKKLVDGDVAIDLLTILPAQRLDQIKAMLVEKGYTQAAVDAALDPKQYDDHPVLIDKPPLASLEGYIYPESFQVTAATPLEVTIRAALDELDRALTPEIRKAFLARGLSLHQAITLASIVEREVGNSDDRSTVAQVFLKRYEESIPLGSDPTALYGALQAGLEPTVFADTPFNTRLYVGLPPGPINNVSFLALQAVAFPSDTDYLFFVSGDDGKTYFSRTLAEHEALTAEHCIELCRSY